MEQQTATSQESIAFLKRVLWYSLPFWLLGMLNTVFAAAIPIQLPISALMAFCPVIAAWKMEPFRQKQYLTDLKTLPLIGYATSLLTMPLLALLTYGWMVWLNRSLPALEIALLPTSVFIVVFLLGAWGEEAGWTGYLLPRLSEQFGAIRAGLILGSIWGFWHLIPYLQAGRSWNWIAWQILGSIALRVGMTWAYVHFRRSRIWAIIFHAMINMSAFLFPRMGSHYDPMLMAILQIILAVAAIWALIWQPTSE